MKKVKMFALSTCGWCRKTKKFLDEHQIAYEFEDVDLLTGPERARALQELTQWNPNRNFPTVVVDDKDVVVGFDEDRLKEVLGL
ncbi:MAG: glutaredoxin family protein [Chloroflexi bacterium]|nr:glutaredoxin family protein [Chloroflexota bacterium]